MKSALIQACAPKGVLDRFEVEIILALLCGILLGTMLGLAI